MRTGISNELYSQSIGSSLSTARRLSINVVASKTPTDSSQWAAEVLLSARYELLWSGKVGLGSDRDTLALPN